MVKPIIVWFVLAVCAFAQRTVYLAPADVPDAASFSRIMRSHYHDYRGATFILAPGDYETYGNAHLYDGDAETGWAMQSNWTINGAGKGLTRIKLLARNTPDAFVSAFGNESPYDGALQVRDLTVDCWYRYQAERSVVSGVNLTTCDGRISNVEVLDCGSRTGAECFGLYLWNISQQAGSNQRIENCSVRGWPGTYTTGIGIASAVKGVRGIDAVIANCRAESCNVAFGIGGYKHAMIADNVAVSCNYTVNEDTYVNDLITVRNCRSENGVLAVVLTSETDTLQFVEIIDNVFRLPRNGSQPTAPYVIGGSKGVGLLRIAGNHIFGARDRRDLRNCPNVETR